MKYGEFYNKCLRLLIEAFVLFCLMRLIIEGVITKGNTIILFSERIVTGSHHAEIGLAAPFAPLLGRLLARRGGQALLAEPHLARKRRRPLPHLQGVS